MHYAFEKLHGTELYDAMGEFVRSDDKDDMIQSCHNRIGTWHDIIEEGDRQKVQDSAVIREEETFQDKVDLDLKSTLLELDEQKAAAIREAGTKKQLSVKKVEKAKEVSILCCRVLFKMLQFFSHAFLLLFRTPPSGNWRC